MLMVLPFLDGTRLGEARPNVVGLATLGPCACGGTKGIEP